MTLNMLLILVEEMRRLEESTERVRLTIQALVLEAAASVERQDKSVTRIST